MNTLKKYLFVLFSLGYQSLCAQEDLSKMLEDSLPKQKDYTYATFKGTRVVNGHSVELRGKGTLEFLISHRFGRLNSGFREFFGLDQATIRLGLDYTLLDRLAIGIGRSSLEKTYDAFVKYKLLRQSNTMPVTATFFASVAINGSEFSDPQKQDYFNGRLAYTYQVLIARKFGERLSLQLTPTLIHRNLVPSEEDQNDILSLGVAGRYKISKRIAIVGEYFYLFPGKTADTFFAPVALGFDIETGGHVFQLHFTNAQAMIEKQFIPLTTGNWRNGDIHFGFNILRVFDLSRKKDKPAE